jgi:hypothetical protein
MRRLVRNSKKDTENNLYQTHIDGPHYIAAVESVRYLNPPDAKKE